MKSLQRLLPSTWQGTGREARWRRSRGRRVLAGLLGGCAVLAVVGAVRPADPPSYPVTVAAHDLTAGQRLGPSDVRQVRWSVADKVPGLLSSAAATGKVLTAPIRAGEPVTSARVRAARSWPALPKGRVVIGVSSSDRALVRVLQPGDRVDLIDTARARTVATAVSVVSVPAGSAQDAEEHPTLSATDAASVLVAVTPTQAAAVGSAVSARSGGLGGGIQLALRAGA
ncbi:MAG TPA: SAF domain-containing protein [Flexivirga sp.]|uniref:SAF domain-containing protein n=1 Tax=Flexivirga sp. TaxID=1962927 RepID=UPI002B523E42|nr:SAF domain-containing protein [Flexivirga sp.]HWC23017.1 SAF domain-containing protein [Flexivirga sp.]